MLKEYEGTEADAEDWGCLELDDFPDDFEDDFPEIPRKHRSVKNRDSFLEGYKKAKAAKVGSVISCPVCGESHTKTTYHKVFCSNGKKSKKDCKSRYHNTINPSRLDRIW